VREALSLSENEREATLAFDAASCDGCRLCESHCPESALTIRRELRVEHLGERRLLHRGRMARCLGCGAMLASANLLRALRARLQGNAGVTLGLQYCPACRIAGELRSQRAQGPPGQGGPALADGSGCSPVEHPV
jgi:ferredoxin